MNSPRNQLRRRHKRYDVGWQALLEIDNPDINDFLVTPVINLSRSGALVSTPSLYFRYFHLAAAAQKNQLNLIIHSPHSGLDSKIHIRHCLFNEKNQGYYLGVEFKNLSAKNQDILDGIIRSIRHLSHGDVNNTDILSPCFM